ncbi:serine/threonine-protein kinase HipA [Tessaracoccus bendigoensis DSM 12906]|uniref:Serine/threonine-protein kinase HipA n=1 Tax=Tessaracoccus bendigoensis DSM 12906 TaxID=1123357 RepID=A0A1M6G3H8_9ACTN|nr:type II toxin-antitoxin system HipA family toxin [Tessaracoccus bendigoensis]SHJ04521.1 serine/threonine-protein kinase HipA [Tessaracoccus bendigoensis DSM 12906]
MTVDHIEVHIDLEGEPHSMGTVEIHDRRGRTVRSEFTYDRTYLGSPGVPALDPNTPLDAASQVGAHVPRGLADAGPDGWGRRLILRAHRGHAPSGAEQLLAVDDLTRIGALRLRGAPSGPFLATSHEIPNLVTLEELAEAANAVEEDADDLAAVRVLVDAGTASLGGVRPKASVRDGDRLMIAKFPSTRDRADGIDVVAWEKLCLDLATAAGITVPANRLASVGSSHALLVDRFDRSVSGRIPYLSAFAITDALDAASGDYLDIAEALADLDVQDLAATLRELWRRVAFSIAMRNTDDHLKNHGVLWSRSGWHLSPAFDITPNPVGGARRATTIDGEDRPAAEPQALVELAREFGIPDPEWRSILADVLGAASTWSAHARSLGIDDREVRLLQRPLAEAQGHLADLP